MDAKVALTLVGISHRTAPVAVRERYVVSASDLPESLKALAALEGVREVLVVSTCNRTEALVVGERGTELAPLVRGRLFRNLGDTELYVFEDVQALIHFFRVAAGLDSLVLGESEILGQIKRSFDAASAAGTLGTTLKPLVQQALHVGKRVRSKTPLGQGTLSVARIGIDVAQRVFGRFEHVRALVVGAGETGVLVARHLAERGVRELCFANRTRERADAIADELGARSIDLDALGPALAASDLVIACVEAETPPLTIAAFDRRALKRRDRPLLVIDLSVPRGVEAGVSTLPNVLLYDLDDLGRVVREHHEERAAAVEGTAEILVSELHKFLSLRTYASFSPTIAQMRERFERARDEVLDSIAEAKSDPKDVRLAHELTKRLCDIALDSIKESARSTRSEEALDREYRRFLENL